MYGEITFCEDNGNKILSHRFSKEGISVVFEWPFVLKDGEDQILFKAVKVELMWQKLEKYSRKTEKQLDGLAELIRK